MKPTRHLSLFLALALLMLATLGCSNFGYENGTVTMDISLSADSLNKIIGGLSLDEESFVGKIDTIEFVEPNIMRITGEFRLKGGNKASGSVDFAFDVTQDGFRVSVVDSSVPGLNQDSVLIKTFNRALEKALGAFVMKDSQGRGGITDVKVKDDQLVFTVSVNVQ